MAAALLGPAFASAAYELTLAQGHTSSAITCHQMGQSDQNGALYTTRGARIYRSVRLGTRLADIVVPAGITQPRDVAPSPNGEFLYISNGSLWTAGASQRSVAKYAPDGRFVTAFGDYGEEDGNWGPWQPYSALVSNNEPPSSSRPRSIRPVRWRRCPATRSPSSASCSC
jgi:hypothetical protein